MGAITESLGLGSAYSSDKMNEGMQVVAVNCYPPCPNPNVAVLGLPPHSAYSCLTIALQSSPGLKIMDMEEGKWGKVPKLHGALQVHVGDHLEVLSNGLYKSVVQRAILNCERTRISIVSLMSLGLDEKMGTAKEFVDEQHPKRQGFLGKSLVHRLLRLGKWIVRVADSAHSLQLDSSSDFDLLLSQAIDSARASYHRVDLCNFS
nr:protein dmr6-like oxygenase 1 [Quercus suber]